MKVIAFVGPSLPERRMRHVTFRPPARQGDVWRALEEQPHAIALIDGVFEHVPSVWHHELRAALASGVHVFGAASMGALRAVELSPFGMVGVGTIFRWYRDGALDDDGAVALLHADKEHGYRPLTVPLVNVMGLAEQLRGAGVLTRPRANRLVAVARDIYYQRRTWPVVWRAFGEDHEAFRRQHGVDVKAADARACLAAAVDSLRAPRGPLVALNPSSFVRRRRLVDVHGERLRKLDGTLADRGTRTLVLAALGRSLGLKPALASVRRFERALSVKDASERLRLAEALALEEQVIAAPERLLSDGPSRLEGLALESSLEEVAGARRR